MPSRRASEPQGEALPPVALVLGSQELLREAAVTRLRERALGAAQREFNEDRFDLAAGGTEMASILAAARTLPLMAERRVVHVRGLADRRARRFLEEGLPAYLEEPVPTTLLVLEAPSVDRRLRWVKQVQRAGQIVDCSGPSRPAEVQAWIEAGFSRAGKRAGGGVSRALFELVGGDLDRLALEIDKVCLFVGDREELTPEDVAEVTGALRPLAVFDLTDAIGNRRLPVALKVLVRLLDQGDAPLAILGALANHFRRLIRARECRPPSAKEIERALSIHRYAAQKLAEQVAHFDPPRLRRCLEAIHRTDEALKGGEALSPRLAIERLVLAVSR
jgi:DNA polymerase-3 subunit delta